MNKKQLAIAALALLGSAAILFFLVSSLRQESPSTQFVQQRSGRFFLNGKPFRFVGANVSHVSR